MEVGKKIGTIKIKRKKIIIGNPYFSLTSKKKNHLITQSIPNGIYSVYIYESPETDVITITKNKNIFIEWSQNSHLDMASPIIGVFDSDDFRNNSITPDKKKWDKWQLEEGFKGKNVEINKEKNSLLINTSVYPYGDCDIGFDVDENVVSIIINLIKTPIIIESNEKENEK